MPNANTNTLVCKYYSQETVGNFNTILIFILIANFLNAFASLFTKIKTEMLLVGFPYNFNKIPVASNEYCMVFGLLPISLHYECCSLASFKGFVVYNNYSCNIRCAKMQLNDDKCIGWYRAFVALLIQTDTTKNKTDSNTGIRIGASLLNL